MNNRIALAVGLGILCGCVAPTAPGEQHEPNPSAAVAALPSIAVQVDLTTTSFIPSPYRRLTNLEALGNTTIPNYLGSIQIIGGEYYTLSGSKRILKWKGLYYMVHASSKYTLDKYGYFCGGGWGFGNGNDAFAPIADGGLDAACRAHDQAWPKSVVTSSDRQRVINGDVAFLYALNRIVPRWGYEAEYRTNAVKWMSCRVSNKITTAGVESRCGPLAVSAIAAAEWSKLIR